MSIYLTEKKAIIGLHEKGFTEDFQIRGNDLFWVREKVIIRVGEFSIIECHSFCGTGNNKLEKIILGIYMLSANVKGILINSPGHPVRKTPPVLRKKLSELMEYVRRCDSECGRREAQLWVNISAHLKVVMQIKNLRFWADELLWVHLN